MSSDPNEIIHFVEQEWHYNLLKRFGYEPDNISAVGLVRSYIWTHPITKHKIRYSIGVNADYWTDLEVIGKQGYWSTLEQHLTDLAGKSND
ncbi:MAG: hypothetical protein EO766_12350 [Hydrotalea sp. AMD]|uniref:hypothetical protein n=1 Tax=Hydrotalea sp. AMD TaxID=2501297 RepID=UPI0010276594|nr:hypothetical protein [Hydrotalea sp. AMD]RWZ87309.1 MAG: hypothetical protein EO766_12350 [Hydrotalea sp. AMD]